MVYGNTMMHTNIIISIICCILLLFLLLFIRILLVWCRWDIWFFYFFILCVWNAYDYVQWFGYSKAKNIRLFPLLCFVLCFSHTNTIAHIDHCREGQSSLLLRVLFIFVFFFRIFFPSFLRIYCAFQCVSLASSILFSLSMYVETIVFNQTHNTGSHACGKMCTHLEKNTLFLLKYAWLNCTSAFRFVYHVLRINYY